MDLTLMDLTLEKIYCNKENFTNFFNRSDRSHLDIIKYLIEDYGVDARANNDEAVRYACRYGHLEIVKYLVEKCGADVRAYSNCAIHWSCEFGHFDVVTYLVEDCGVDVRCENDYAIGCASENGHLEVVKYLVEKCGADVRAEDDSVVECASENGHLEVVKYLTECGAVLLEVNPKYERYLVVYEKGEKNRRYSMAKRIYFWWVQMCYNPTTLTGQRSMYKGYKEYLNIS